MRPTISAPGIRSISRPRWRPLGVIARCTLVVLVVLVGLAGPRETLARSECTKFFYTPPESPFEAGATAVPVGSPVWVATLACEVAPECTFWNMTAGGEPIGAEVLRTGCGSFFPLQYSWLVPETPWVVGDSYTVDCGPGLYSPRRFVIADRPPAEAPHLASVEVERHPRVGCGLSREPAFTFTAEVEGLSTAEFAREGGLYEITFGDGSLVFVSPEDLDWVVLPAVDGDITVTTVALSGMDLESITVPAAAIARAGGCAIAGDGHNDASLWLLTPLLWLRRARRIRG